MIELITTGSLSAVRQMQIDSELIESLALLQKPLLRAYSWERKSITYGYFIDIEKYIDVDKAVSLGYDLARRPTGGGLLFHGADFSFTFAIGASHPQFVTDIVESYQVINQALLSALNLSDTELYTSEEKKYRHLCMATPTKYDLVWQNKKIGGAAQRRTKAGLIHQSSLFLEPPHWQEVATFYRGQSAELDAMKAHSVTFKIKNNLLSDFVLELNRYFSS
jgi:lipoate-protein ligase A